MCIPCDMYAPVWRPLDYKTKFTCLRVGHTVLHHLALAYLSNVRFCLIPCISVVMDFLEFPQFFMLNHYIRASQNVLFLWTTWENLLSETFSDPFPLPLEALKIHSLKHYCIVNLSFQPSCWSYLLTLLGTPLDYHLPEIKDVVEFIFDLQHIASNRHTTMLVELTTGS